MRDEYHDRIHQAYREQFGRDIARLASSIAYAFERMTARLYDAPWSHPTSRTSCDKRFTRL